MRKILLLFSALLAAGVAGAQENSGRWSRWSVTPHVGVNVSRLGGSTTEAMSYTLEFNNPGVDKTTYLRGEVCCDRLRLNYMI
ncbi:MAG: hypothetical protein IJV24_05905 [Prevotella sp.]|nr:hypothetical protein [Prevotella sp.]